MTVAERLALIRQRLRRDPDAPPARVWARARWLSLAALTAAVAGILTLDVWLGTCGFEGCPSGAEIRAFHPTEGGRILDRRGVLLGRLTQVHRTNVPLASIPQNVRDAFIATEDRRFYQHHGLDWHGVARAVVRDAVSLSAREGFSTITMQVARNAFAARRYAGKSLRRKLMELRLARLLENNLTKDRILELYLNVIYLGDGAFGVEAASQDLFGKDVGDLSLAEGAMLAALPKGPSAYTPRRDPERALRRRNLVLSLMAREGYVTTARAERARRQPLDLADARDDDTPREPYALDAVRDLVDSILPDAHDEDYVVHTTLDATAQRAAERSVRAHAAEIDRESRGWYGRRADHVEGALVAIDPSNGDIVALVGGRGAARGGFDRAFDAHRQPGSAFKPFVYAAALADGYTPASLVEDEPVEVQQQGRIWRPANYSNDYQGTITFEHALAVSSNVAAVRVSRTVGERSVIAVAHRNGIRSPLAPVPSIALGTLEVTPLELVDAYAPFANGGYAVTPRLITDIETPDGTVLWRAPVQRTAVMDPRDAFQLTSMLRSVVDEGTGRVVRDMGIDGPVAGKTGTTDNGADVWFVGYTPTLVAGVWFGYDKPRPIAGNATGGRLAAPAWADFYRAGWRERATDDAWSPPPGMIERDIDPQSGELAGPWCPTTEQEWFKPGTEPTAWCHLHQAPESPASVWAQSVTGKLQKIFKQIFHF